MHLQLYENVEQADLYSGIQATHSKFSNHLPHTAYCMYFTGGHQGMYIKSANEQKMKAIETELPRGGCTPLRQARGRRRREAQASQISEHDA